MLIYHGIIGVPLLHIHYNALVLEKPSKDTLNQAQKVWFIFLLWLIMKIFWNSLLQIILFFDHGFVPEGTSLVPFVQGWFSTEFSADVIIFKV